MILKANRSVARAFGKLSPGPEIVRVHVHAIQHHHDLIVEVHDLHFIPLAGRFRGVSMRLEPGNDSACIVVVEFVVGFVWVGVVDLHLDALLDRIVDVSDPKIKSAVTAFPQLVFELDIEIFVSLLRP